MKVSKPMKVMVALGALAMLVAACGSDKNKASGTTSAATASSTSPAAGSNVETTGAAETTVASSQTGAGGGGLEAAKANAAKYKTVPTKITQTAKLKAKPPKKKVGFVVCADPSCEILESYLKEATTAFGWDLVTVSAPATDPGSAVQQLIDSGVDYIAETGINVAQFQAQADELKSKGIPLFECYATDVPAGKANNLYSD